MNATKDRRLDRRGVLLGLGVAALAPAAWAAGASSVVTVLGDSITAGLGLPARDALPAQLQAALERLGVRALVRGAGVSGDTTGGGLARVDFSVASDTNVCVVALGGNDLLQGADPGLTKANLRRIIEKLKARRIRVVLAGVRAPTLIGAAYAREFTNLFPALARETGAILQPDFVTGVIGVPRLMQRDGLHPNAAGARIVAERLAPSVAAALRVG
ncbi:MAG: arylesterase [Alphaproteobacteria bacterium]|nr:arylesterase [Alphaproteobacteria bacterium]